MSIDINSEGHEPSLSSDPDIMSMSDEDILNMPFPAAESEPEARDEGVAEEQEPEGEVEHEQEDPDLFAEDGSEESVEDLEDSDEGAEEGDDLFSQDEADPDEEETEADAEVDDTSDYKSQYDMLMAPFKANGKEIVPKTADDLRRLAQMGVGYNAKMAELKPIRKIAKMLENEGLLDAEKINYLIDLSKNNPDAINKLVKDSGINPLDIDTESTEGYKPNTYTVNDNQLALDEALDDLERTSSGQRVIDVVSNKWDKNSKQVLVSNPAHMRQLEQHINDGIFDKVVQAVEQERTFGRIPAGVSDLEAYNVVGAQMAARGDFNTAPAPAEPNTAKKAQDTKRKTSRKRAAASPKGSKPTTKTNQANVLSMSDEEFEKTLMSNYM